MAKKKEIKPEDIKFDEETVDDAEMPRPETKEYTKYLKVSDKFMALFHRCVDSLPYNTILTHPEGAKHRLIDIVRFVEAKAEKFDVNEMNSLLGFIGALDFAHARPLMEVVENKEAQAELWSIYEA